MKRLGFAALLAVAASAWGLVPAGAGGQIDMTIEPTEGPPGTVITAHLDLCNTGSASARLRLVAPSGDVVADTGFVVPTNLEAQIQVPDTATAGTYTVRGTCNNQSPDQAHDEEPFVVTGPPPPTPPAPPPAEPVTAAPRFTG